MSPAALSIVTTTFAEGRTRTRAMGVWAAIAVGGGAVGLLLGGILTEYASWRWIFFVNIPIGLLTFVFATRFVPESRVAEQGASAIRFCPAAFVQLLKPLCSVTRDSGTKRRASR